jgi:hypothetical protein
MRSALSLIHHSSFRTHHFFLSCSSLFEFSSKSAGDKRKSAGEHLDSLARPRLYFARPHLRRGLQGRTLTEMQGTQFYSFVFTFRFSFGEGRPGRSVRASDG